MIEWKEIKQEVKVQFRDGEYTVDSPVLQPLAIVLYKSYHDTLQVKYNHYYLDDFILN